LSSSPPCSSSATLPPPTRAGLVVSGNRTMLEFVPVLPVTRPLPVPLPPVPIPGQRPLSSDSAPHPARPLCPVHMRSPGRWRCSLPSPGPRTLRPLPLRSACWPPVPLPLGREHCFVFSVRFSPLPASPSPQLASPSRSGSPEPSWASRRQAANLRRVTKTLVWDKATSCRACGGDAAFKVLTCWLHPSSAATTHRYPSMNVTPPPTAT
jgi:hypothetical protein